VAKGGHNSEGRDHHLGPLTRVPKQGGRHRQEYRVSLVARVTAPSVAGGDEPEKQPGPVRGDREIAGLVHDWQGGVRQRPKALLESARRRDHP